FTIALLMLVITISLKAGLWESKYFDKIMLFETGALFMGSFIGSLALLIMSDEYYVRQRNRKENRNNDHIPDFIIKQILAGLFFLFGLYIGNILHINIMLNIIGTFGVLWMLDFEKSVLTRFSNGNITISLL